MSGKSSGDSDAAANASQLALPLRSGRKACAEARHAVRDLCIQQDLAHLADDAELLTSELVTNAIEHAVPPFQLFATCASGEVFVEVLDQDAYPMAWVTARSDLVSEGGRGMHLVTEIAVEYGMSWRAHGKSVWFRLR